MSLVITADGRYLIDMSAMNKEAESSSMPPVILKPKSKSISFDEWTNYNSDILDNLFYNLEYLLDSMVLTGYNISYDRADLFNYIAYYLYNFSTSRYFKFHRLK